jgi:acetylornithine deacetylase/succinyl-diaminopimelate desuccinylase-like protein
MKGTDEMTAAPATDSVWLESSSDAEEAAALLAQIVAIRSLPGEEGPVQQRVASWLVANGLVPDVVEAAPGRPNVTVTIRNGDGPTLLLNGHVDTASIDPRWDQSKLLGYRDGDTFIGLGAGDMKAGVVAIMLATRALDRARDRWKGTVIFSSVVDEEAYSIGAHALIDSGLTADYCVVAESAWERPCLGSFGKVLVRVDVTGKAAHASSPGRGINAAVEASRFVARLDEVPLGSHPRISPTQCVLTLKAGPENYESIVVPESAQILINWHTTPGETAEDVITRMQTLVTALDSPAEFAFATDPPYYPAWETPVDAPITQAFARAFEAETGHAPNFHYTGYGDMNLFSTTAGIPTVMFGAKAGKYHEADEWVDLPSIGAVIRVLLRLTCDLLPPERTT